MEAKIKAVGDTACKVTDVTINGVSVVAEKVANIDLSSKADVSALTTEVSERKSADSAITKSITDEIARAKEVEATKADASELSNYVLKSDYDALKTNYDTLKATLDDVLNRLTAIESVDALDAGNY